MASDIWLRTILIVRKETCCCHIGYSYRLTARVLLYAPSHRQDNTYHCLCYTSRGALAGTRNSSMGPSHHERTLLPRSYISLQVRSECLTCTYRASCCSVRLSRVQVPAFVGSSVRGQEQWIIRSLSPPPHLVIISFQPVLHSWFNSDCGMYYPVYGMVQVKYPLLLLGG